MRSHMKVYFNFEEDTNALNDSEKGRLLLAMLRYANGGEAMVLTGNERFLFPVFKAQIDRDIETYETKVANGSRGGRPTTKENREEPEETENNLTEPKETETLKIEDRRQKIEDRRQKNKREVFTPPTADEVAAYCRERGNTVNADRFCDFYSAKGWKVGNQPMKDWRACVRTWEQRENPKPVTPLPAQNYNQRDYSHDQDDAVEQMMRDWKRKQEVTGA